MNKTTREKNIIIVTSVFYIVLVIGLIIFFFVNTFGEIDKISETKIYTQQILDKISQIEKKGLTYNKFIKMTQSTSMDKEYKEILKNIGEDFFKKNLQNNEYGSFEEFINNKKNELNSSGSIELIKGNNKQIIKLLPTYIEGGSYIGDNKLSDLKFINYIESIIETFNLDFEGTIGIGKVVLLENYITENKTGEGLNSNLYYIPLSMNLSGTKENILDFLYFIEKVGNIKVENNRIKVYDDSTQLNKNGFKRILSGDKYNREYNIFENQLIDISDIKMSEYIDSSYTIRDNISLTDFLKKTQGKEKYNIQVNLLFYIKGEPTYLILDFINNVINDIQAINRKLNSIAGSNILKGSEGIKFKKKQTLLQNLNKKSLILKKDLRGNKNLEGIYKSAISMSKLLEPLCKEFEGVCKINK